MVNRSAAGFTLMEVLIAIVISSVVVLSVITLNISAASTFVYFREKASSNEEASYLLNNLTKQVQMAGGGPIGIAAAIWVEDGNNGNTACPARAPFPACDGSDRLTLIKYGSFSYVDLTVSASQTSSCLITSSPSPTTLQIYKDATNGCCLTADFANKQTMLVLNTAYAQKYITSIDLASCQVTITDGPAKAHNSTPVIADWTNGSLNLINMTTYYLDTKNHYLMQYVDQTNSLTLDTTTTQILSDQIYDFQVALGYDVSPGDGVISDLGNELDEWLYNAPGKSESLTAGFLNGTLPSSLSMVELGVTLGFKDPSPLVGKPPVQLLNGPPIAAPDGMTFISATNKLMPRNLQIFK